ncbi:hypothetical protein QE152_g7370 [Popillia japonica]|uniref:Endonuclease/exonuclease/phosphatase domain-containing protein n=1 Tax=Popillia japonica TaxID=7064 RepID=A0AAW1MFW3_POPJA
MISSSCFGIYVNANGIRCIIRPLDDITMISSSCFGTDGGVRITHKYDVIVITETSLTGAVNDNLISLNDYTVIRKDRWDSRRAGSVAIYFRSSFKHSVLDVSPSVGFECLRIKFFLGNTSVVVGVIYRPPQLDAVLRPPQLDAVLFVEALEDVVSGLLVDTHELIILGDFNINYLESNTRACFLFTHELIILGDFNINYLESNTRACFLFNNMCDSLCFKDIINEPTRETNTSSTLIDFILVLHDTYCNFCGVSRDFTISDLHLVYIKLDFNALPSVVRSATEQTYYLRHLSDIRDRKFLWDSLQLMNIYNRNKHMNLSGDLPDVNQINRHFVGFMSVGDRNKHMNLSGDLPDVNQINRHFVGFMSVGDVDAAVIDYCNANNATGNEEAGEESQKET